MLLFDVREVNKQGSFKRHCSCVGFAQNHKAQSSGGKEAGLPLSLPMSFVARVWLFLTQTNEGKCPQQAH